MARHEDTSRAIVIGPGPPDAESLLSKGCQVEPSSLAGYRQAGDRGWSGDDRSGKSWIFERPVSAVIVPSHRSLIVRPTVWRSAASRARACRAAGRPASSQAIPSTSRLTMVVLCEQSAQGANGADLTGCRIDGHNPVSVPVVRAAHDLLAANDAWIAIGRDSGDPKILCDCPARHATNARPLHRDAGTKTRERTWRSSTHRRTWFRRAGRRCLTPRSLSADLAVDGRSPTRHFDAVPARSSLAREECGDRHPPQGETTFPRLVRWTGGLKIPDTCCRHVTTSGWPSDRASIWVTRCSLRRSAHGHRSETSRRRRRPPERFTKATDLKRPGFAIAAASVLSMSCAAS